MTKISMREPDENICGMGLYRSNPPLVGVFAPPRPNDMPFPSGSTMIRYSDWRPLFPDIVSGVIASSRLSETFNDVAGHTNAKAWLARAGWHYETGLEEWHVPITVSDAKNRSRADAGRYRWADPYPSNEYESGE